jgi:hypothetical protein
VVVALTPSVYICQQRKAAASAMKFLSGNMDMTLSIPDVQHAEGYNK